MSKKGCYLSDVAPESSGSNSCIAAALVLVREFGRTPPSVQHLRDRFGMSRSTAYRWVKAWRDVFSEGDK